MSARPILICGGIGAGKSVVSRCLRAMGQEVYDCDMQARRIVDGDPAIIEKICLRFGQDVVGPDGVVDRPALAARVFGDPAALRDLGAIVHGAVRDDISHRLAASAAPVLFVETAIPRSSLLDTMASEAWMVTAPDDVRLRRVMARNGATEAQVRSRMLAQRDETPVTPVMHTLANDGRTALLPRIQALLGALTR